MTANNWVLPTQRTAKIICRYGCGAALVQQYMDADGNVTTPSAVGMEYKAMVLLAFRRDIPQYTPFTITHSPGKIAAEGVVVQVLSRGR